MSIQSIKNAIKSEEIATYDYRGQPLYFRKVGLQQFITLNERWNALHKDESGKPTDSLALLEFFVDVLVDTLVDDKTREKDCDSDEGRSLLRSMPIEDLSKLGLFTLINSGMGNEGQSEAKKNSPMQTTNLPSTSVENSESSTPITST